MSAKNSYYKLIRERLENSRSAILSNNAQADISGDSSSTISSSEIPNKLDDNSLNENIDSVSTKDELKLWHDFAIQLYFSKISHVTKRTKKSYFKIIKDFMEYSLDLNLEDLEHFMEFKIKISDKNGEFKHPYYGTQAKYASTIKRFLQTVFTTDPIKVKIKHYKLKRNNTAKILAKMDHKDVIKAYEELSKLGQYEDAVIIHTMYILALDPYALYMLTYEGIINDKVWEYWDHKTGNFKCKVITKELINDFRYLKILLERPEVNSVNTIRTAYDGKLVSSTFIFRKSPTNISAKFISIEAINNKMLKRDGIYSKVHLVSQTYFPGEDDHFQLLPLDKD